MSIDLTPVAVAEAEIHEIKNRENNRTLARTDDLGLGDEWTVIGTVDLGNWKDWNETQRLAVLEELVPWSSVESVDKRRILEREVDFSLVAPEDQRQILGEVWNLNESLSVLPAVPEVDAASPDDRPVRPLTNDLINAVLFDVWPKVPTIVDFGIDSAEHLGALQFAIKYGEVTPHELDAAMGNGAKLTEIVQRGDNPYRDVTFRTSWDEMRLELPDETMAPDAPAPLINSPDQRGMTERILFGEILHGGPSPAPQPEKPSLAKSRDDGGIEM
jgi:hypothetical protein